MAAVTHPAQAGNLAIALRVLARLLAYPDEALRRDLPDLRAALQVEHALGAQRKQELDALIGVLEAGDPIDNESAFVELFDRGRATSLHLFEHVHGDSRERGPAMVDLEQTYAKAGLYLAPGELPDYLPVIVEFVSTQTTSVARSFLAEMAHLFAALHGTLHKRASPYASVLAALLDLSGEPAHALDAGDAQRADGTDGKLDSDLDADWAEPVAFAGCSSLGQTAPGQTQTIHFVPAKSSGVVHTGSAPDGVSP